MNCRPMCRPLVIPAMTLLVALMTLEVAQAQVMAYQRKHRWLVSAEPSAGLFAAYSGFESESGNDISDLLRWGAGLRLRADYQATDYAIFSELRAEYQQSHSSGKYPQKGPSIFDLSLCPLYKLIRTTNYSLNLALQGGVYTALLPEVNTDGVTLGRFFDPAALYEGLFLQQNTGYAEETEIRFTGQIGYAFQQLVRETSTTPESEVPGDLPAAVISSGPSRGNGPAITISLEYAPQPTRDMKGSPVVAFNAALNFKALNKRTDLLGWRESRVESYFRTTLTFLENFDFENTLDVVYDSSISFKRDLRVNFSINYRYHLDVSSSN